MWMWTGLSEAMSSDGDIATMDVGPGSFEDRRVRITSEAGDETVSRNLLLKFLASARQSA